MSNTAAEADREDISHRLLESAETLSYDPIKEIDWAQPPPEDHYGLSPQWSSLYGTRLWDQMSGPAADGAARPVRAEPGETDRSASPLSGSSRFRSTSMGLMTGIISLS
ncbi:diiron oxygenase [Saccharopolyspora sp. NPDC000995]